MANFSALKTAIQNAIRQNGNEEITGDVLQQILLSVVNTMGDGAINTIEQNLSGETLARQSADNTLQSNINSEALARGNADTQLQNAINAIKANIDNGYVYAGIATPSTTPVSGKVFYAALQAGTYTNFGGTAVTEGITFLKYNGTSWIKEQVLFTDGGVFDISAYHATGGNLATYADLSAALGTNGANVPENVRKGGMSVKYVQSSDNNYIRYNLTANEFTTDETKWVIDYTGVYVENAKWNYIITDKDGKIAFGIKKDGSPDWFVGIPTLIQILLNTKVDKENGKGLIDEVFSGCCGSIENSKHLNIIVDSIGKIVESWSKDGNKNIYGNLNVFGEIRGLLSEELMNGILSQIYSPHIFYCGSTREYTKVKDVVEAATQYKGSIVYLDAETFDITAEFGSDYLDNYDGTGNKMTGMWLKNDIHIIGANGSKLVFNYQGNNTQIDQYFSVFNADNDSVSTGFTLENVTIESTNGRYCVHDDPGQFAVPYHNKYLRCHFINYGERWGDGHKQALGGGFGFYGDVVIDGCQFESNAQEDASYHNTTSTTFLTAKSKVTITNTYFEHTFRCANFGLSPLKSQAFISGCSLSSEPVLERNITDTRADNMELISWNNEIRN